jgi:hypothetical protein
MVRLSEKITITPAHKAQLDQLQRSAVAENDFQKSLVTMIDETDRGIYRNGLRNAGQQEMLRISILTLLERTENLSTATRDLSIEVVKDAEVTGRIKDEEYKIATWASYGLYVLGWALGLLGKMYGVETGGSES